MPGGWDPEVERSGPAIVGVVPDAHCDGNWVAQAELTD